MSKINIKIFVGKIYDYNELSWSLGRVMGGGERDRRVIFKLRVLSF